MTDKPNILLLVLDAVRYDHVGCYGYDRETTPTIDSLAEDGVKFKHAFAPSIWTPAVHGAIFTGLYPSHSGIYGNSLGFPDDRETLPETLKREDYRTFAASAGAHIRASRGYDRGVDEYISTRRITPDVGFLRKITSDPSFVKQVGFSMTKGPDDKTLYKYDRLRKFIKRSANEDRPFYGFINAKTAHQPFNPPRPYKSMFCENLERPRIEVIERFLDKIGAQSQRLDNLDIGKIRTVSESGGDEVLAGDLDFTEEEWSIVEAWYDGAIRYLDDLIGRLVAFLKEQGVYDDTMIVVTSDHGDNFGDHGLTSHIFCLYDSIARIPLIIKPPHGSPSDDTIDGQVSLVDLHRTFVEAASGKDPNPEYELTTSLLPLTERRFHEYTFCEYAGFQGPIKRLQQKYPDLDVSRYARTIQSIRNDEHKLIVDSTGNRELYAWREDPHELEDLAQASPEIVKRLESALREQLGTLENPGEFSVPDDPRLQQQLKDLGYL